MGELVVGNDFAIHVQLAHAPPDKLRGLRSEIKNDDFLLHVVVGLCWGRSRMTPLFVSFCKVSDFPLKSGAFDILILAGWMC